MNKFLSKKEVKFLSSLKQKKFRKQYNEFVIEGEKLIFESLNNNQFIKKIVYSKKIKNFDKLRKLSSEKNIPLHLCTEKDSQRISDTKNSQQIFALIKCNDIKELSDIKKHNNEPFIILDGISDPGNMGTILRTCSWFGCYNIIITKECVEIYNPKTVRSGMGAHFHITNLYQLSVEQILSILKNESINVIAATLNGTSYKNFNPSDNWALILGNEAHGVTESMLDISSEQVSIPRLGNMESLNVGVAGSVLIDRFSTK